MHHKNHPLRHHKIEFRHIFKGIGHEFKNVTHVVAQESRQIARLPAEILHTADHMSNNLALPLLIIGGVAIIYFINKN